jgi:subtilase family serine protease
MRRILPAAIVVFSLALLGSGTALGQRTLPAHADRAVCARANAPTTAACSSRIVTQADGVTPLATTTFTNGYAPADLLSAYKLAPGTTGPTVAIVDAYDNPNAQADLDVYRQQFGLPACDAGCFTKVNQTGGATPPAGNTGWGQEIDLDIEMVSAICPGCKILLVEASSNSLTDLGTAVNYAASQGVAAISNSYGTSGEFTGETSYDSFYNHPRIAVTASSGDNGYGVEFPAADNHVVAVGGTSLTRAANLRGWSETAWSGAGSGCSAFFTAPAWQTASFNTGCASRAEADVSAVADPNTGVAVYDSYGSTGGANWFVFGGTSVASPIIASVFALAGNTGTTDYPASLVYGASTSPNTLNDVTSGSNGNCVQRRGHRITGSAQLCTAGSGWDGPTGLGTPIGVAAF